MFVDLGTVFITGFAWDKWYEWIGWCVRHSYSSQSSVHVVSGHPQHIPGGVSPHDDQE